MRSVIVCFIVTVVLILVTNNCDLINKSGYMSEFLKTATYIFRYCITFIL